MLLMAKGPRCWANSSDLWRMGEQCGIGRSFHCIQARAEAAMLRALELENWERLMKVEVEELSRIERDTEQWDRKIFWATWYANSFPERLMNNKERIRAKGIDVSNIKAQLLNKAKT